MKERRLLAISLLLVCCACVGSAQVELGESPLTAFGQPQLKLLTASPNFVEGREFFAPSGVALDTSSTPPKVYVSDTNNNRVLGWEDATSFEDGKEADIVVGQVDKYSTSSGGPNGTDNGRTTGLFLPAGLAVDSNGDLFVFDVGNNRILRYPHPFQQEEVVLADYVIGQAGLNQGLANSPSLSASTIATNLGKNTSERAACSKCVLAFLAFHPQTGDLYVTDAGNHRILRFPKSSVSGPSAQNQPEADLVLGQVDFQSSTPNTSSGQINRTKLLYPAALTIDDDGLLYVGDSVSRVLVFEPPFSNGKAASRIVGAVPPVPAGGQPLSAVNQYRLSRVGGLFVAGGRLFVVDSGYNRILRFPPFTEWPEEDTSFSPAAEAVFGQAGFEQSDPNRGAPEASPVSYSSPLDAVFYGGETYVVDSQNNRVLVVPSEIMDATLTGSEDVPAVRVLGQTYFNLFAPNYADGKGVYGARGLAVDTSSNPSRLYVVDTENNRILGFADARKVRPGSSADLVIGQLDLLRTVRNWPTGKASQPTSTGLSSPVGAAIDAEGNLWVADQGNSRVLRFPKPFETSKNADGLAEADLVIGQLSFTSRTTDATARTMSAPCGIAFTTDGNLLVSDSAHNRVLFFRAPFTAGQSAEKVFGQSSFTSTGVGNTLASLNSPQGIDTDNSNRLYVADTGNNRVAIISDVNGASSGAQATLIIGSLSVPTTVAVSRRDQRIYVGDVVKVGAEYKGRIKHYANYDVLQFDPNTSDNVLLLSGQGAASVPPLAITLDKYDNLIVSEVFNRVSFLFPKIDALSGANYFSKISPYSWASIFPGGDAIYEGRTIASSLPFPDALGDVQVLFDDEPAIMYFICGVGSQVPPYCPFNQINFLVPSNADPTANGGAVQMIVQNAATGQIFGGGTVRMLNVAPALFTSDGSGSGPVAAVNEDHTINGPGHRIEKGQVLTLYGTGVEKLDTSVPDGLPATAVIRTSITPSVYFWTTTDPTKPLITAATVEYSGTAPGLIGVWQINVRVPSLAASGEVRIVVAYKDNLTDSDLGTTKITTVYVK